MTRTEIPSLDRNGEGALDALDVSFDEMSRSLKRVEDDIERHCDEPMRAGYLTIDHVTVRHHRNNIELRGRCSVACSSIATLACGVLRAARTAWTTGVKLQHAPRHGCIPWRTVSAR